MFSCSDYTVNEKNKCGACFIHSINEIEIFNFTRTTKQFIKEPTLMTLLPGHLGLQPIKKTLINSPARISSNHVSPFSNTTNVPTITKTTKDLKYAPQACLKNSV